MSTIWRETGLQLQYTCVCACVCGDVCTHTRTCYSTFNAGSNELSAFFNWFNLGCCASVINIFIVFLQRRKYCTDVPIRGSSFSVTLKPWQPRHEQCFYLNILFYTITVMVLHRDWSMPWIHAFGRAAQGRWKPLQGVKKVNMFLHGSFRVEAFSLSQETIGMLLDVRQLSTPLSLNVSKGIERNLLKGWKKDFPNAPRTSRDFGWMSVAVFQYP